MAGRARGARLAAALPFPVAALADLTLLAARLVPAAAAAVRGGLPWIVLRARGASTEERVRLGRELLSLCPGLYLTVHGDPDACRELGAAGLHLPGTGFDVAAVRRAHPGVLLGVSCHGAADVECASAAGADYAFLSPLFAPTSKTSSSPPLGREGFRAVASRSRLPLLALGGIRPERLEAAAAAGAAGAAVLGDLFLAPDPMLRAVQYRRAAERTRWLASTPSGHRRRRDL
ncbi:MAG: thiamine phosphate synthase [Deltaproteobacteria bacterium]|nr:thiamine phosphate synthase [Deltaproteobacteria bacterium]